MSERRVVRVAVVHTLSPFHAEWAVRLNCAILAFCARYVDYIIITGGRCFEGGKEVYNNPYLMMQWLLAGGVPRERVLWREVADCEVATAANTADTADEVRVALAIIAAAIAEKGWQEVFVCPISNDIHMPRILAIWQRRAKMAGMKLHLEPLTVRSLLGWKWALMEIVLFRLYTLVDQGWTGPIAEWMRERRRRGSSFGLAGGSSDDT